MLISQKQYSFAGAKEDVSDPPLQIFDLLQLSRQEREAKLYCMQCIRNFSRWRRKENERAEYSSKISFHLEGIILRRKAYETLIFYRGHKKKRVSAFQAYLEKLPVRKATFHLV